MVGDTSFVGRRCSVMAAHRIKQPSDGSDVYRFQGVALPKNMLLNHFAFSILERRAAKLVTYMDLYNNSITICEGIV